MSGYWWRFKSLCFCATFEMKPFSPLYSNFMLWGVPLSIFMWFTSSCRYIYDSVCYILPVSFVWPSEVQRQFIHFLYKLFVCILTFHSQYVWLNERSFVIYMSRISCVFLDLMMYYCLIARSYNHWFSFLLYIRIYAQEIW